MKGHPQRGGVRSPLDRCLPARGIHLWDTRFLRRSEPEGQADGSQTASTGPCHTPSPLKTQKIVPVENRVGPLVGQGQGGWTSEYPSSGGFWIDQRCFRFPGLLICQNRFFPCNYKQSRNPAGDSPTFGAAAQSISVHVVSVCTRAVLLPPCSVFMTEMFAASVLQQTRVRNGPVF